MCDLLSLPLESLVERERGALTRYIYIYIDTHTHRYIVARGNKRSFGWSVGKGRTENPFPARSRSSSPSRPRPRTTTLPSYDSLSLTCTQWRWTRAPALARWRLLHTRASFPSLLLFHSYTHLFIFSSPILCIYTFGVLQQHSVICIEHLSHCIATLYYTTAAGLSCCCCFLSRSRVNQPARARGHQEKDLGIEDRSERDHDDARKRAKRAAAAAAALDSINLCNSSG